MMDQGKSIDDFLEVGSAVVLDLEPSKKWGTRFRTTILGWSKSEAITVKRPKCANRLVPLKEEQPCVVRFLYEGNACAFTSLILDFTTQLEDSSCRIAWPKDFELVSFRRFERIRTAFPCEIAIDEKRMAGEVRDISIGGAGVYSPDAIEEMCHLSLTFTLPNRTPLQDVQVVVRNARRQGTGTFLGCEFEGYQEQVQNELAFFVRCTLDQRQTTREHELQRVLIIDEDHETAEELRRAFEKKGWDVFTTSTTLDGLSRLRILPPNVLVINQDQSDLSGLDAARMVKATRGFDSLPVFVFSAESTEIEKRASEVGAVAFFRSPFMTTRICDAALSCASGGKVSGRSQTPGDTFPTVHA